MSPKKVLPTIKGINNVRYSGKQRTFFFNVGDKQMTLSYSDAADLAKNDTAKRFIGKL